MPIDERSDTDAAMSVIEDLAQVGVRRRVTGRTRLTTRTGTLTEDVAATLQSHGVHVTRVPVRRDLDPAEPVLGVREEGETTILPVLEEVLVVETRLRLFEEVQVRRTADTEEVTVPVELRRQVAEVEHDDVPATDTDL